MAEIELNVLICQCLNRRIDEIEIAKRESLAGRNSLISIICLSPFPLLSSKGLRNCNVVESLWKESDISILALAG